jgi:hypothetical protein
MNRRSMLSLTAFGLIGLCATAAAAAQETQTVSFKVPAENAKYIQQLFIDVGDVPGHQVRVFELRWSIPSNSPVINGVKLTGFTARATTDYTTGNGAGTGYIAFEMENGDKFFSRITIVAQNAGSSGKSTATTVGPITGGTGKFSGIRGIFRQVATFDPKTGFNEAQSDIEYRMEK